MESKKPFGTKDFFSTSLCFSCENELIIVKFLCFKGDLIIMSMDYSEVSCPLCIGTHIKKINQISCALYIHFCRRENKLWVMYKKLTWSA